jgi:hypothetical protein
VYYIFDINGAEIIPAYEKNRPYLTNGAEITIYLNIMKISIMISKCTILKLPQKPSLGGSPKRGVWVGWASDQ